ncbi:class A beta-lactamase-related serine hydrolase [Streptomyces cyaneochromogenes]|uniref:Class A beta-lactamase-related serine hydrolase n=1 Tax=Streptomyces cyaneochromogenes TaxID=2496836 RepID=A0A3S9MK31_9ACTN|nr:serine hydrolase domain-containing protein [Streptomyces cyaneochromogenes]AZQ39542.1 class A beta-lactamase-related serine hydrolase [Streptomyces cyaneochromogenes]
MADGRERLTRRQLGQGLVALGGALAIAPFPAGPAAAASSGHGGTLRHGSAERAGLLPDHLDRLVTDAKAYLGPSPKHPWYAGAVLLAGRGSTVALHQPIGMAVRYQSYDEKTDTGVEFPAGRQIAMAEDTVFDLASVSKLFTSILAVQQIERGALGLEATVASYLPDFGRAGKQDMTVRQLLTHTSGFRAWIPLYNAPTYDEKLQLIWNEAPLNPPGTTYLYSDLNLISLQLVLEKITGRTLDALLRDEITAPLGMRRTRYNPPAVWKPRIAATEDARKPWSGLDRGLVWGEVHDENAFSLGGVAGHAGVFSNAWDLAVLGRTLLNGGVYGRARILDPESVELMFTDFNTAFPGDEHGLGFELYQHWYMGAMATPHTAGHTGFTGTSLVLDPSTDSFLVVLGNSVHPVRGWRSGSAPRVAAANNMARAVSVRPRLGRTAWFSGMATATTATLALPPVDTSGGEARLRCALWWDTEPKADLLTLEATTDGGATWQPLPFTTTRHGGQPQDHPAGTVTGWSGRVWHRLTARLPAHRQLVLRWRYATDRLYVGRGAYVDGLRVEAADTVLFDEARPADTARISASGWTASAN